MTTLYARNLAPNHLTSPPSPPAPPASIPALLYRVHHTSAQTQYSFSTGFRAKNQSTVLCGTTPLARFGLAHLHHQTNISSPFISMYDNLARAEQVALYFEQKYPGEEVWIVTIDTKHLAWGPVFRAADILKGEADNRQGWVHEGEYLVLYTVPKQAVRVETLMTKGKGKYGAVGLIGGRP
ncbi:hypothetical protein HBI23_192090 [Parastagonospora nodorum]|nr:hypothetical protein HBI47_188230 [Parastagonospora nodorum]KAH5533160.1 hypothetical protein HBI27_203050 [Parastagonospora nodorum]KAH5643734.1 hypothetical protein HBI23_192090 [Parastagonospora nodorum]KAH6197434.1 hypothetical protein HBI15_209200 [Parastagonospora nodorum]